MTDAESDVNLKHDPANSKTRPSLTAELMARLRAYGSPETIATGDLIYQLGDDKYDLILIESGRVDLLSAPAADHAPSLIAEMAPGDFLGEVGLSTSERMFITARTPRADRAPKNRRRRVPTINTRTGSPIEARSPRPNT
jgi:CRP-like cAMP-binding protein